MHVLRRAKKVNSKVTGSYSAGGRVFAWVKPSGETEKGRRDIRVPVNTHAALLTFCEDVLQEPLANYLQVLPH